MLETNRNQIMRGANGMKRNIDILIEIQIKIYRFKFAADDISVAMDVNDAELSDLIKGGNKSTVVLMNMIVGITGCLDLLTEDIKASMMNEGFDIDDFNEWTAKLLYNPFSIEGMLETIENALGVLEVYILETMRGYRMLRQLVYDVDTHLPDYIDAGVED